MHSPEAQEPATAPDFSDTPERVKRDADAVAPVVAAAPQCKRPRYGGKAFAELTIADLERIVRENTELKKQVTSREEEIANAKELLQGKDALAKQVKALEADLEKRQKEAERLKSTVRDQDEDVNVQADRVKRSLRQQLSSQMFFHTSIREQLQGQGRDIVAFAANVSPEVLKALGGEHGTKNKYAHSFFETVPAKTLQNGTKMVLARVMIFKYFKSSCELRVDASYRIQGDGGKSQKDVKRPSHRKKQPKKAPKKPAVKAKGAGVEDDEEDEGEGEGEEVDEGEDDEECEGEADLEQDDVPDAEPAMPAPNTD